MKNWLEEIARQLILTGLIYHQAAKAFYDKLCAGQDCKSAFEACRQMTVAFCYLSEAVLKSSEDKVIGGDNLSSKLSELANMGKVELVHIFQGKDTEEKLERTFEFFGKAVRPTIELVRLIKNIRSILIDAAEYVSQEPSAIEAIIQLVDTKRWPHHLRNADLANPKTHTALAVVAFLGFDEKAPKRLEAALASQVVSREMNDKYFEAAGGSIALDRITWNVLDGYYEHNRITPLPVNFDEIEEKYLQTIQYLRRLVKLRQEQEILKQQILSGSRILSLDVPVAGEDGESLTLADVIPNHRGDLTDDLMELEDLLHQISVPDSDLLKKRYVEDKTVREISEELREPYDRVNKRLQRAEKKIRRLKKLENGEK